MIAYKTTHIYGNFRFLWGFTKVIKEVSSIIHKKGFLFVKGKDGHRNHAVIVMGLD